MGIMWTVGSLLFILISQKIQHLVKDDSKRASVHSLFTAVTSLASAIVLYVSGILIDSSSIVTSLIYVSSILTCLALLVLFMYFFIYKYVVE
ncbi:MAG: hypothetical protein ACMXYB_02255 [Candidatus Woesearchaeota archaeon]